MNTKDANNLAVRMTEKNLQDPDSPYGNAEDVPYAAGQKEWGSYV